jgi:hypothetical protein
VVSCHFAKSILHYKVNNLKVCTVDNLLILERIKNGPEQLLIMYCGDCVSLHGSDPPAFEAESVNLRYQLVPLLIIVVYDGLDLLESDLKFYIFKPSLHLLCTLGTVRTSDTGTYPSGLMLSPSSTAPCLRIQLSVFEIPTSLPEGRAPPASWWEPPRPPPRPPR